MVKTKFCFPKMQLHIGTSVQAEPWDDPQQQRAALISVTCLSSGKRATILQSRCKVHWWSKSQGHCSALSSESLVETLCQSAGVMKWIFRYRQCFVISLTLQDRVIWLLFPSWPSRHTECDFISLSGLTLTFLTSTFSAAYNMN